jgi:tetratricopeptide (TPR) repeat protein
MIFQWLNASEAEKVAAELADQFAPLVSVETAEAGSGPAAKGGAAGLQDLLRRADTVSRLTHLYFYKKARFANSFKWRLLEKGIEPKTADYVTHSLIGHLWQAAATREPKSVADHTPRTSAEIPDLLRRGNKAFTGGDYTGAIELYRSVLDRDSSQPEALNGLGAALSGIGQYAEAEQRLRQAVATNPNSAEANCNLGTLLRLIGNIEEAEVTLRQALKLKPNYVEARTGLGWTLILLGRLRDAKTRFEKVLKTAPRHAEALLGLGQIAKLEGRFPEAEARFKRVLEVYPKSTGAWAGLATLRRMTPADGDWLKAVMDLAASSGLSPLGEAELHFAIGKYYDDIGEFDQAFRSYETANRRSKSAAAAYDRKGRDAFVNDLIRAHSKRTMAAIGEGGSASIKPVFVLGMPRSGTSLAEHILASHPSVRGGGELEFWYSAVRAREADVRTGLLDSTTRQKLAEDYLRLQETRARDASRIVDKTPVNSDYIGIIHSVFPNARFIYMERDAIDTCLSCFFQQFVATMSYCMDLSDLAHYHKAHCRLIKHWQSVLPPGKMLVVPYEGLVRDQQGWTRKMLDFIGLEWDDRVLSFQDTQRIVATSSAWQVRQKMYSHSVGRSQHYKKFLGPLKALGN